MSHACLNSLVPRPRSVSGGEGSFVLFASVSASVEGSAEETGPAVSALRTAFGPGLEIAPAAARAALRFRIVSHVAGPQSYRLRIAPDGVRAEAQDRAGLFYAAVTLAQLARLSPGVLPVCTVEDAPDFPVRGVMIDISRDKVPTMATLFSLVDRLASLKINQFQLYTEHTFAYRDHAEVWRKSSPITAEEVRALDVYCRERCIDLVPNQNSFGHLERWLSLPRYNVLAELPQGGAPLPWGGTQEKPTSLCPSDPRSIAFLSGLYDELLPNFTSGLFNVGCDETFDLRGNGRSAARVRESGEGRVYLEFLKQIYAHVTAHGRTMAFWGDIIIRHPELVRELPADVVALEWGYEADHPFDEHGALFAKAGVPFYVCPGTSSWNSLGGRTSNMRANLRAAAVNGLRHGACGYVITDWGDWGHWQPLAVSYAGFVYGAALAWGAGKNGDLDLAAAMDVCGADGWGQTLLDLGDVYLKSGALRGNGTELFHILSKPQTRPLASGVTCETLSAVMADVERLAATMRETGSVTAQETLQVARLLLAACHRGLAALKGPVGLRERCRRLARETDELMASHAVVWLLRNREGGLEDSLARFSAVRREYGA